MLILFKLYVFSYLMSLLQAHIMRIPQPTMNFIYFQTVLLNCVYLVPLCLCFKLI